MEPGNGAGGGHEAGPVASHDDDGSAVARRLRMEMRAAVDAIRAEIALRGLPLPPGDRFKRPPDGAPDDAR